MPDIERIDADPDLIVTALQRQYIESSSSEPTIHVDESGAAELAPGDDSGGADGGTEGAIDLPPKRFVGDLDLPDPDAELSAEGIETLGERLGSEVRPALRNEITLDADGGERVVPVEYSPNSP
jgi:hypothetical protein